MVKCESLRMNMYRITHTGKISKFSRNSMSHPGSNAKFLFVGLSEDRIICAMFRALFMMVKVKACSECYHNTNDDSTCHRPFKGGFF